MTVTRTIEPTNFTTNGTIEWTRTFSDYPADEWTLQYRYRHETGEGFNIDATQNAVNLEKYDVVIDPADTEDVEVTGRYKWEAWVTNIADTTIVKLAASGHVQITPGFDADDTDPIDRRSIAKQIIDAIDAAMLTSDGNVVEYTVSTPAGMRKVVRSSLEEAMKKRDKYAAIYANELARERARNGKPVMGIVQMRVYD